MLLRAVVKKYAVKYKNNCPIKLFYLTVKKQTSSVSSVGGVCNFLGSVSSQQKFEAMNQHYSSRTGQHYSSWTDQCQTSPDRSV